jgi:hypothetical protein
VDVAGPQCGQVSALESRTDVLAFTWAALDADLVCAGLVSATVAITSANTHSDLFVRICDVTPEGEPLNVIEGLLRRIAPVGERQLVPVDLGPIGHRFSRGHRIRIQISGGAHPFYDRNLGTGQPWLTATVTRSCTHHLHVGPAGGTTVRVPVVDRALRAVHPSASSGCAIMRS